ncbi:MAG TPA: replicative DNA helicase [Candidatus Dormibacteraeota bacterium]|nr:replicative DNA helicase [Candidatus Dormibacteraeota bacterium]
MTFSPQMRSPERVPPQNLEAEMAVLGSILIDREIMPVVAEIVRPDDFYAVAHETIYRALTALYERGAPLDTISLADELRSQEKLDVVGGLSYLTSLQDVVPTSSSAEYYAKVVAEKAVLRQLIHAGGRIAQMGFEQEDDVEGALNASESIIFEISQRNASGGFTHVSDLLRQTFETLDKRYHQHGSITGLPTGFPDFDHMTAGLQPGNLIIVAARPAMGKTSMALTMAANAAARVEKPIAVFSLEMSNDELIQRFLSLTARLDAHKMRTGRLESRGADDDWEKLSRAMNVISEWPVYLDDQGGLGVADIRSRCRRLMAAQGLSMVVIDYLQLLVGSSKNANRNEELSTICRQLKTLAKELNVPIVALAQLNRGVESRNDKRPMLSDLRDSGAIEQEADVVTFLYREGYYNPDFEDETLTELIIAKHRNGPVGTVKLRFFKEYTLFVSDGEPR